MLTIYLSAAGTESVLGSEKWAEILEHLQRAGIKATRRHLKQMNGYYTVDLRGDRHLAMLKVAHGGIPRLNYRDLAFLSVRLLGSRLGERWKVKDARNLNDNEHARRSAARREIRQLEIRRTL